MIHEPMYMNGVGKWCYKCGGKKAKTGGYSSWYHSQGMSMNPYREDDSPNFINEDNIFFFQEGGQLPMMQMAGQKPFINSSQLNQIIQRELGADDFRGYRELNPEARRKDWRQNKNNLVKDVRQNFTLNTGYSPSRMNRLTPEMEQYDYNNQPSSSPINNTPSQQPFNPYYTGQQYNDIQAPYDESSLDAEHEKWKWQKNNPALKWENRNGVGAITPQADLGYMVQNSFNTSTQNMLDRGVKFNNKANIKKPWNPFNIGLGMEAATGVLGEFAGMYDRGRQDDYMRRWLQRRPQGYNDGRSEPLREGYSMMQKGGIKNPYKNK